MGGRGVAGRRSGCVLGGGAQVGEGATVPGRGAWAPVERSGWRGAGARRRDMAAGGRLEDVSEAPSPGPAIPASCAGLRGRRLRSGSYPEPPRPGPEGTLVGRGDLRAGTAVGTPFRVEVGGTRRGGRGGPFSRRLTCGARRCFRNWDLHVTRAGLTGLPERE